MGVFIKVSRSASMRLRIVDWSASVGSSWSCRPRGHSREHGDQCRRQARREPHSPGVRARDPPPSASQDIAADAIERNVSRAHGAARARWPDADAAAGSVILRGRRGRAQHPHRPEDAGPGRERPAPGGDGPRRVRQPSPARVGRDHHRQGRGVQVSLADPLASRRHARLRLGPILEVEDLGSATAPGCARRPSRPGSRPGSRPARPSPSARRSS
jgi:hypothetical protein